MVAVTMAKSAALETIRALIWAAHAADGSGKTHVYEQLVWAIGRVASADVKDADPTRKGDGEPLLDGQPAAHFIKSAYGLLSGQTPRFDLSDPTQAALRRISDWVRMAEADALNEDPTRRQS